MSDKQREADERALLLKLDSHFTADPHSARFTGSHSDPWISIFAPTPFNASKSAASWYFDHHELLDNPTPSSREGTP